MELKNIACQGKKTLNQLKGGSGECEFYCTYFSFEHTYVHPEENLKRAEIEADHPMNLREEWLLDQKQKLPHMRFLLNSTPILDLSIQLLFEGIRNSTSGHTEKEKMKTTISFLLREFMGVGNVGQLRK